MTNCSGMADMKSQHLKNMRAGIQKTKFVMVQAMSDKKLSSVDFWVYGKSDAQKYRVIY